MDELISIVVSTYNWPEALDLSLKSLSRLLSLTTARGAKLLGLLRNGVAKVL